MTTAASKISARPQKTFRVDALTVNAYATGMELAHDAAGVARAWLRERLAVQDSAAMMLATGNSQIQFLAELEQLGGVDWSRVTLFHLDEYLGIDANHPASFRRWMRERVEKLVQPRVLHYLAGDAPQPIAECDRYTQLLQAQAIDLCCLGIGENGHLAFNDPGVADFADERMVKIVRLDEACRRQQVGEGHFAGLASVPQYALTLTIPALCSVKKMLCIAPEERKAVAVKNALAGPISAACPASILRLQSQATLFLDQASASLI